MDNSNRASSDNNDNKSIISVDEIVNKIRQELAIRQDRNIDSHNKIDSDSLLSFPFTENLAFSHFKSKILSLYPTFSPKKNGVYHVSDLLPYHQEEFVKSAYIALLGREADPVGLNIFLNRLERGMSKIEILGRMRYSPEGRKKGVQIRGLLAPLTAQMIYKIPVLGYLCRFGVSLLRLPKTLRDRIDFEHSLLYQNKILQRQLNQNFKAKDSEFIKLSEVITEQGQNLNMLNVNFNTMIKKYNEKIDDFTGYVNQTMRERDDRITLFESNLNKELDRYNGLIDGLNESVNAMDAHSATRINELNERAKKWGEALKLIESKKAEKEELLHLAEQKAGKDETHQIQDEIKEILKHIHDHKLNILDQHRRLKLFLEEARKQFPKSISRQKIKKMIKEEDHLLDAMYVSFEDRFRGTREDIKTLMKEYLPYIKGCKAGTANAPILDIGCGRGEWLEICGEEGLKATGVDINNVMIAQCSELGLDVTQTDAIQFLKDQESKKFGAITGFHFIEHIELSERITFFDETLRVLKPGGVALFETPNPENLTVGAFSFYIDPTHKKPLVPETMQFILEQRGFVNVEIKRLHKNKEYNNKKSDQKFKNKWFFSEMDYALIGYKK
ncbi:MAG: methyltransferase domain-containing protein [Deltaproteobacteria bacterium]|nr:methyltransferase domain-containing protein [Deltaproteobacteria bacterium]